MNESLAQPLGVDSAPVGPWARAEKGPRGTRLVATDPPKGARLAPGDELTIRTVAPRAVYGVELVADGKLALAIGDGRAYSIRVPEMSVVHNRAPAGLDRIDGATVANAGLLHGDEGWRIVVLPSLGDIATDLGDGPVALRPDARQVAVAIDGRIEEFDLTSGDTVARHGSHAALTYAGDGSLLVANGAALTWPGGPAADGSPIVAARAAARAWRAVARHADGTVSIWGLEESGPQKMAEFMPPLGGPFSLGMSPDGEQVGVATSFAEPAGAAVLRAEDGAVVRFVEGARAIGLRGDGSLVLGAEWGIAFMRPMEDST
ncbi:MAG: hypothetical protein OEM67_04380 [Thermoleophilia bacterium]|nr:hypothetical protein [Thermoleophilia bacterium]MDH3725062.1 hypothetical protein [Thermoleophilia bacterium]